MLLDSENHVYRLNDTTYTSVTTLVHLCFEPFDADKVLAKMKITPQSQYYGMSKEEIKQVWKKSAEEAQQQGTRMHSVIERYYKKEFIVEEEYQLPEIKQFMVFESSHSLVPFQVEWRVYNTDVQLAGTIDFAALNSDGTLDLYDWKRTKQINTVNTYNKYSQTIGLPDTNYWHYTVQLNLYKYLIEKNYDKKVNHMYLVSFHPTKSSFEKYEVTDIQAQIPTILEQLKLK
jgi:hypothetical protein